MRLLGALMLLLLLIVGAAIVISMGIQREADALLAMAEEIQGVIANEDWEKARELTENLVERWNTVSQTWDVFIQHAELDQLTTIAARLEAAVVNKDKSGSFIEAAAFTVGLESIQQQEILLFRNVF